MESEKNSRVHLFLSEDFVALQEEIEKARAGFLEAMRTQKGVMFGGECQGGDDLGIANDVQVQGTRFRLLESLTHNIRIVSANGSNRVGLGKTVTLEFPSTGKKETFIVRGCWFRRETKEHIPSISCCSPLARIIVGAQVGEKRRGVVAGEDQTIKVLQIE